MVVLEAGGLRPGAERAQRRLRQRRCGSACRRCAPHFGDSDAIEVARAAQRLGGGDRRASARAGGRRLVSRTAGYLQVSTAPALGRRLGADDRAPAGSSASPTPAWSSTADEVRRALRLADLPRRRASTRGAATVQPARLARGLRERVRERGVEVYERTTVGSVRRRGGDVVAEAKGGRVRAEGRRCSPPAARCSAARAHAPAADPDLEPHGDHRAGPRRCSRRSAGPAASASPTRGAMIHYFRTTPDGRIAFGWGGGRVVCGARTHGHAERRPGRGRRGRAPSAPLLPRARGQADRPMPGAGRSTSRPATCR